MPENIREKIKDEIKKSGFPLEIDILQICSKQGLEFEHHIQYDYKENKKEIDIYTSYFEVLKGRNKQATKTSMIIECKKSKNKPWVFFSLGEKKNVDLVFNLDYESGFNVHLAESEHTSLIGKIKHNLKKNHYFNKEVPQCISYIEAFKKTDYPSDIHKGIESVLSFLNYRLSTIPKNFLIYTEFLYPVIILEGRLFEAAVKGDQIDLEEREHIQLLIKYNLKTYFIDVIKKEYFDKFLDQVKEDHLEFIAAIDNIKFSKEFLKEVDNFLPIFDKVFGEYRG